ncbi:hypothetical protein [Fluviibacter phosphoraccumulans]|jgi:hypothetical protein
MNTQKKCGCGRSPTGFCVGWHSLNDADYAKAKSDYEFEQYQKRAESLWFKDGSCTSGKSSA